MPNYETAHYALQKPTRTNPANLAPANVSNGVVRYAKVRYVLTTDAVDETIQICILPVGAVPLPELSSVSCGSDPGTTLLMDIGNTANPDGWADGISLSSGGRVACDSGAVPAWFDPYTLPDENNTIYATYMATTTGLTPTTVVTFNLAYKMAN